MVGLGALVELALGAVGEVLYERLKFLQENLPLLQTLPKRSEFLPKHNLRMVTKNICSNQRRTMLPRPRCLPAALPVPSINR